MMEHSRFPRSIFGTGFPNGFVAGLLEEADAVPEMLASLAGAGVPEANVRLLPGEHALRIDASHHPSLARGSCLPGEEAAAERFLTGALLGDLVVAVRADAMAREVAGILTAAGLACVHRFEAESVSPAEDPARAPV